MVLRASIGTLGLVVVVLGAWAAIVSYVGPLFGYPMPPGSDMPAWHWSAWHTQLHLLPGIAAIVGGLMLMGVFVRGLAMVGGVLALAAGAWLVVGNEVANLWLAGAGFPPGENVAEWMFVVTRLGYHDGTGLVIAALAALALGLLAAVPRETGERMEDEPLERERVRAREREYVS